jgi:ATP-dependent Clp protease ATP-binding subunit ClpC
MKPALARGDIRCIGATTIAEYRRYIESDSALERRFEKIIVNEPSPEEALEILRGIKPKLEDHHHVEIEDSALEAAVNLSIRFDGDHQLPDKAIDLVDKSSARTRIPILSMGPHKKEKATSKEICKSELEGSVTGLAIAQVLSSKIGVPLEIITGHLQGMEQSRLLSLESFLKERLIGQDEAIERVNQRLLLAHSGLAKRRGPLAVFMFLGPTGVGKTELAKLLAEFLFGNKSDMIRLDMSEYMEEHSVAKLIGSPPGYIGYEQEGQLTGKLRTNPYSVVLLDEVEKAAPRVFDMFLQVFDDGRMTDAKGRTIDARNAIFVMTSNINVGNINETPPIYDGRRKAEGVREKLKRIMRPEFVNRIDEVIEFQALGEKEVKRILKPMLNEICLNLQKQHNITLQVEEEAESYLARAGYNSDFGVRALQRTVERLIQIPLSRLILSGELKKHSHWQIIYHNQGIAITPIGKENGKGANETERL